MKKYNLLNLNFKMVLHFGHSYFFEVFVLRNHFNEILFLQIGHFLVFIEQYFLPNQINTFEILTLITNAYIDNCLHQMPQKVIL